jgi:hypothetical protein
MDSRAHLGSTPARRANGQAFERTRMPSAAREPAELLARRDRRDELTPITTALFIAGGIGAVVDGPTPYPQAAVARVMLVSKRADRCYCSALTTSA